MIRTSIKYDLKKIHRYVSIYILKKDFYMKLRVLKRFGKLLWVLLKILKDMLVYQGDFVVDFKF